MNTEQDDLIEALRIELSKGNYQMDMGEELPYTGKARTMAHALWELGYRKVENV